MGKETLISVDGEFTGPIPGPFSMISLGAVAYDRVGVELSAFKTNMEELTGSRRDDSTMVWWLGQENAWELATVDPVSAVSGITSFSEWIKGLPGKPKLMGWPYSVDFLFIYWYYVNFLGAIPPFGFDGIDIKTYAMRALSIKNISDVSRTVVRKKLDIDNTDYTHDPVDDAREQAKLYFGLRDLKG